MSRVLPKFNIETLHKIEQILLNRQTAKIEVNTSYLKNIENEHKNRINRRASVLIPLCNYNNKPSIIYTKRSMNVPQARGDIAFPGGHIELNETPIYASIREFYEECLLNSNNINITYNLPGNSERFNYITKNNGNGNVLDINIRILGHLYEYIPSKYGTKVTPIVGYMDIINGDNNNLDLLDIFNVDKHEVDKMLIYDINMFTNEMYQSYDKLGFRGDVIRYDFNNNETPIWGLTAFLTQKLIQDVLMYS